MNIYYILLAILFFMFILQKIISKNKNILYIFIAGVLLFIVIGFRDYSVGTDTLTYLNLYLISGDYVKSYFINPPGLQSECLFFITTNLIRITGASPRIYFIITAIFISFSISLFLKRYSKCPFLSYWLYITLGMLGISMSALRQILAICITLYSFDYLIKGKRIKYIISVLIASLFHFSAIWILPVYLLRNIKLSLKERIFFLISSVSGAFLMKDFIILFLYRIGGDYSRYYDRVNTNGTSPLVVIVAIAISAIGAVLYEKKKEVNGVDVFSIIYVFSCINCIILMLSLNIDILSRLAYYFGIINIILLSNAIDAVKNKYLKLIMFLFCMIISLSQFVIATPGDFIGIDNYLFNF